MLESNHCPPPQAPTLIVIRTWLTHNHPANDAKPNGLYIPPTILGHAGLRTKHMLSCGRSPDRAPEITFEPGCFLPHTQSLPLDMTSSFVHSSTKRPECELDVFVIFIPRSVCSPFSPLRQQQPPPNSGQRRQSKIWKTFLSMLLILWV